MTDQLLPLGAATNHAPTRIAMVGAGVASAPHLQSLHDLQAEAQLAWVLGRDPERLAALTLPEGTRRTTRLQDVLEDPSISAALVLTPPHTHLDIVQRLAQAGKHVLVEKPLDITLAKAEQLVAACEAHGVTLAVMLQHRLREGALALAALVRSGELGPLTSASTSVRWWRPQSYYDVPGRGTLARDGGGVLMTQAIHTLDLMVTLTGLPERVTALATTSPVHNMEGEDTVTAVLQWPGGAIGSLDATTAAYPGFAESIALNFAQGSATLQAGELRVHRADGQTQVVGEKQASGSGANIMAFDHQAHRAVISDFLSSVRHARPTAVSGRSALQVHKLIDALMASAQQGTAFTLTG